VLERVAATISRYGMLAPDARVMVAVSGGPDSVCLLHVLREMNVRVIGVAHVNHKLRGEDSEQDEVFVRAMAGLLGLEFAGHDGPVTGGNLEQAARRIRREFFHGLVRSGRCDSVALGHTRDDQAETVLFRMLRGSGLAGLAGILPVTAEGLVRPLLDMSRAEVEAFLRQRGIPWREDTSNREPRFARNRIRHHLLPELKSRWNPRLDSALAHMADLAYEEERWWAAEVARTARDLLSISPGAVEARAADLAGLPRSLARRLVRHAIRGAKGSLRGIEFGHIESVLGLLEGSGEAELPGIRATRSFDWLRLEVPGSTQQPAGSGDVGVPGRYPAPDGNTMICLEVIRRKQEPEGCATLKSDLYFRTIPERLFLRGWKPGDRYRPAGHAGDWKLKELFQRKRIPSWRRPFWPILCMGDQILWARDFGPAAEYSGGGPCKLRIREIPAPN
jgi:tRNA(Ile)-lysidine synthase